MADSVIRLKVDSSEYEGKIKRAAQGIQALGQNLRNAGKTFADADKDAVKFAQELGKMQTVSTTARGKIGELSSAFVNLKSDYLRMTDAEKQSPIGQAMSKSLEELKNRTISAKRELEDLNKELNDIKTSDAGGGGLFSGDKLSGMLQVFGGNVMTKVAGMGVGLASEIGDAVKQGIALAKQGEGIRIAFERLGRGDILDGLREATHGTVTDLELMKAAVKFNDFRLPVEELGTMLAFAQQKAKDTGQSVDYMVDSIVTGLGRKSLMILDNLGLSAAEIKEKMAETGDMTKAVGEIIREQMSKAGDYVETAADRAQQANVSLQNKMEELGRKFAPLEEASNNFWTSMKIGILDVVGGPLTNLLNKLTEAGRLMNAYGQMGGSGKVGRMTANLSSAREGNRQSIYQQQQQQFWKYINPREQQIKDIRAWQRGERGEALQGRINAITEKYGSLDVTKIQAEIDAAKKMLSEYQQAAKGILTPIKADIDTSEAATSIDSLKQKLKDLEEQRKKAIKAGDTDLSSSLTKQINQVKADIRGLDPSALKTGRSGRSTKKVPTFEDFWLQMSKNDMKLQDQKAAGDLVKDMPSPYQMMFDEIKKQYLDKKDFDYGKDISKEWKVDSKGNLTNKPENRAQESMARDLSKFTGYAEKTLGGVGDIVGGLSQLGVEIPKGLQDVLGGIQGITSIVTGIASLVAMIEALTTVQTTESTIKSIPVIGWALARGGIVRAAGGTVVPGNYGYDAVPALLTSGELVLNKAQQRSLSDELQGNGMQNMRLRTEVSGRNLIVVIENDLAARGKGQLATFK